MPIRRNTVTIPEGIVRILETQTDVQWKRLLRPQYLVSELRRMGIPATPEAVEMFTAQIERLAERRTDQVYSTDITRRLKAVIEARRKRKSQPKKKTEHPFNPKTIIDQLTALSNPETPTGNLGRLMSSVNAMRGRGWKPQTVLEQWLESFAQTTEGNTLLQRVHEARDRRFTFLREIWSISKPTPKPKKGKPKPFRLYTHRKGLYKRPTHRGP